MKRAAALKVDHVFLDLEDAVAPQQKIAARSKAIAALNGLQWIPRTRCVRVNDVHTPWCHDDIIDVVTYAGRNMDTVMLPKANRVSDVLFVHTLLEQLELKLGMEKRIGIECLIEDVEGMQNVDEIAACSDRLEALILGMGDYSASHHIQLEHVGPASEYSGDIWHYARCRMTVACRANRIDPIDGPFASIRDLDRYRVDAMNSAILGLVGKWALHPSQIEIAEEVFSPDPHDVAVARKQKAAYERAVADGHGAIEVDGVMVDAATMRIVRNIIDRADLIGM